MTHRNKANNTRNLRLSSPFGGGRGGTRKNLYTFIQYINDTNVEGRNKIEANMQLKIKYLSPHLTFIHTYSTPPTLIQSSR